MSAKHTPGPWSPLGGFALHGQARPDMLDYRSHVECIAPFTDDCEGSDEFGMTFDEQTLATAFGRTPEEAEANARLIAAAPDLLTALDELYAWAVANSGTKFPAVLGRARVAIAKAEGA